MKNSEMKIIRFDENDVIATSNKVIITLSNLYNGTAGDAKMNYNGLNINFNDLSAVNGVLNGTGVTVGNDTDFYVEEEISMTYQYLSGTIGAGPNYGDNKNKIGSLSTFYNGTYYWDKANGRFVHQ